MTIFTSLVNHDKYIINCLSLWSRTMSKQTETIERRIEEALNNKEELTADQIVDRVTV